jgi:hypothetical protein
MPPRPFEQHIPSSPSSFPVKPLDNDTIGDKLRTMVDTLQVRLENIVRERNYYAPKTTQLQNSLRTSAPECLEQVITLNTLQVADILLELDDLRSQNENFRLENVGLTQGMWQQELHTQSQTKSLEEQNKQSNDLRSQNKAFQLENVRLTQYMQQQESHMKSQTLNSQEQKTQSLNERQVMWLELDALRLQNDTFQSENDRLTLDLQQQELHMQSQTTSLQEQREQKEQQSYDRIALGTAYSQIESLARTNNELQKTACTATQGHAAAQAQMESILLTNKKNNEKNQNRVRATCWGGREQLEANELLQNLQSKIATLSEYNNELEAETKSLDDVRTKVEELVFEKEELVAELLADRSIIAALQTALQERKLSSKSGAADEEVPPSSSFPSMDSSDDFEETDPSYWHEIQSTGVDCLQSQISKLKMQNEELRVKEKSMGPVRSQFDTLGLENAELKAEVAMLQAQNISPNTESSEDQDAGISKRALDLTIQKMTSHIEVLEEEKQNMDLKCADKAVTMASIQENMELQQAKVEMLENLVKSLSNGSPVQQPGKFQKWKLLRSSWGSKEPNLSESYNKKEPGETAQEGKKTRDMTDGMKSMPLSSGSSSKARRMSVTIGDLKATYTGPLGENGLPNGTGTIRFKNGNTYLGEVKDGEMYGKGTLYQGSKCSNMRRGNFENNVFVPEESYTTSEESFTTSEGSGSEEPVSFQRFSI